MARCLEMCGHPTPTTKWIDFSFQKPKASTHPALTPGLVEPCFYSGAFFFLLFLIFFFHLKFFSFSFCPFLFSHLIFLFFFFFFFLISVLVFCCGGYFSCLVLFLLLTFLVLSSLPSTSFSQLPKCIWVCYRKLGLGPETEMEGGSWRLCSQNGWG